ncbi:MAG: hypothetical protein ACJ71K_13190 [Nitrososphaeraceae archaeon]
MDEISVLYRKGKRASKHMSYEIAFAILYGNTKEYNRISYYSFSMIKIFNMIIVKERFYNDVKIII